MLILCEKPSAARDFAEALGCGGRRGYYQNETATITCCIGHLFELAKPESYHPSYRVWDATKLPIIPDKFRYKPIPDVASQTGVVLSLIRKYAGEDMVVATDAGREGELIARLVFREAGITDISRIRRFWVSEALTKEVIRKGLETAKPWQEYNRIALEGAVRQQADWLIGINLTRYMTYGNNTLFSVRRVQTTLLNAIALRNSEVARFIPVPFVGNLTKKTSPKKEFFQDTLFAFMENLRNKEEVNLIGLRTSATRSGIIKNLFDRRYIWEDKKKLYARGGGSRDKNVFGFLSLPTFQPDPQAPYEVPQIG
jgi:DNA topoisomerase-3